MRVKVLFHIPFTIYFLGKVDSEELLFCLCYKDFNPNINPVYITKVIGAKDWTVVEE